MKFTAQAHRATMAVHQREHQAIPTQRREYEAMLANGTWLGGYVKGLGYCLKEIEVCGSSSDSMPSGDSWLPDDSCSSDDSYLSGCSPSSGDSNSSGDGGNVPGGGNSSTSGGGGHKSGNTLVVGSH